MHKRTAHRWRLTAILLAGTFFAFGSFWLLQVINNEGNDMQAGARGNEPDYIVDQFSVVRMSPDGQPRYIISGDKLTHRPLGDWSDIDKPHVQSLAPGQPPMTINALRARIDHANDLVHLIGNVDVERPASATGQHMRLRTDALTVLPDEDRMHTDRAVDMTIGTARVSGTGLEVDNAARTLHFASKGRIVYPPRNAR